MVGISKARLPGLVVPAIILIGWEVAARLEFLPPSLCAPPSKIAMVLGRLLVRGELARHLAFSLGRLLIAVCLGTLLGIVSGLSLGQWRTVDRLFSPFLQLVAPIPVVVWMPFAVLAFGTGEPYKISLGVIASFLILHMHTFLAVCSTQRHYLELADMYEKSPWDKVWHVYLPASSPSIFAGVRLALSIGWIVIFFVEYASAQQGSEGLGWFISDARAVGRVENEYAGVVMLALAGFLTDDAVRLLQRRVLRWVDTRENSGEMEALV